MYSFIRTVPRTASDYRFRRSLRGQKTLITPSKTTLNTLSPRIHCIYRPATYVHQSTDQRDGVYFSTIDVYSSCVLTHSSTTSNPERILHLTRAFERNLKLSKLTAAR